MNSGMDELVLGIVIGAVVGLLVGLFFGRRSAPGNQENRELEQKLDDAKANYERFEQRVNAHFSDTAGRLNALTDSYREVYEHIARGAADLCPNENGAAFNALSAPDTQPQTIEADSVVVEPPRDYAPKSSDDDPGVLHERFGLEEQDLPPEKSDRRE